MRRNEVVNIRVVVPYCREVLDVAFPSPATISRSFQPRPAKGAERHAQPKWLRAISSGCSELSEVYRSCLQQPVMPKIGNDGSGRRKRAYSCNGGVCDLIVRLIFRRIV